jgi:hypothetical protein
MSQYYCLQAVHARAQPLLQSLAGSDESRACVDASLALQLLASFDYSLGLPAPAVDFWLSALSKAMIILRAASPQLDAGILFSLLHICHICVVLNHFDSGRGHDVIRFLFGDTTSADYTALQLTPISAKGSDAFDFFMAFRSFHGLEPPGLDDIIKRSLLIAATWLNSPFPEVEAMNNDYPNLDEKSAFDFIFVRFFYERAFDAKIHEADISTTTFSIQAMKSAAADLATAAPATVVAALFSGFLLSQQVPSDFTNGSNAHMAAHFFSRSRLRDRIARDRQDVAVAADPIELLDFEDPAVVLHTLAQLDLSQLPGEEIPTFAEFWASKVAAVLLRLENDFGLIRSLFGVARVAVNLKSEAALIAVLDRRFDGVVSSVPERFPVLAKLRDISGDIAAIVQFVNNSNAFNLPSNPEVLRRSLLLSTLVDGFSSDIVALVNNDYYVDAGFTF